MYVKMYVRRLLLIMLFSSLIVVTATTQAQTSDDSFQSRCDASGVILCEGFDDQASIDANIKRAGDGTIRGTLDTAVRASGNGSLRFEIPGFTAANQAGSWDKRLPQAFAEGDTFYVQFRQRFTPEMFNDMSGKGWKQIIFANQYSLCARIEITTFNFRGNNFPGMYDRCGVAFELDIGSGDFLYQWSEDWPANPHPNEWVECHYHNFQAPPGGGCLKYKENDWMVFYYEVYIGTWGQPNSYVKAWVGYEGEELHMFMKNDPWTAYSNNSPDPSENTYNRIWIGPYDTGKNPNFDHPTAYTWYDELIVSTEPIAPPFGELPIDESPPTIVTQPQNQNIAAGDTATFSVTVTGAPPLTYQWQKDGADISGATNSSYTTPPTTLADNNTTFTVVVTNSYGGETSIPATLTVQAPVLTTISVTPSFTTVQPGGTLQFSATGKDQFGNTMEITPVWSVSGGGTIDQGGLFSAGLQEGGPFTVKATDSDSGIFGTAQVTIASGPQSMAHWQFDEGTSTTVEDASGNGNTGTVSGATWIFGKIDSALDFDGVDDYVDVGTLDVGGTAISIALWFKADTFNISDARLVSKATSTAEQAHYFMVSTTPGPALRFRLKTGGTTSTLIAGFATLTPGVWTHAAVTYDGNSMKIYQDGVEVGSRSKSGSLDTNGTVPVWIGGNPGGYGPFDGVIDDVHIYNAALTQQDIQVIMNEGGGGSKPGKPIYAGN